MVAICCVQMNPKLGRPERNRRRADELLGSLMPGELDFVVLPELAFTGYMFESRSEILPFAEPEKGATFDFCRKHAVRLQCCVAAGFVLGEHESNGSPPALYNAMTIVDRDGTLLCTYRKTFLYDVDKSWASKGPGFGTVKVGRFKVGFGICMDLNPEDFDMENDTFALASHCAEKSVDIILFSTNWLASEKDISERDAVADLHNYWLWRLGPLMGRPVLFAAANRTGIERRTRFAGGSCVLSTCGPTILGSAGADEEGLVLVDASTTL